MRSGVPRYPVDRYLVESSNKFEMVNIIDDEIWNPEPVLRPEDEIILRKLHEMLQSTADDLKLLSGELCKFHEPGVQVKSAPTPLDEEFNEKVHIEELVNAKFHGYKIVDKPLHATDITKAKPRNDTIDGVNQATKILNTDVKMKAAPVSKRPVINRNLGISRIRVMQINGEHQNSIKEEKLNNAKVINNAPAVAYNEFSFKYVEPKANNTSRKVLQIQNMPSVNIRSELKEQKVLQIDILPEFEESKEITTARSNVTVVTLKHETLTKQVPSKSSDPVQHRHINNNIHTVRKISKMSTCESSGSTNIVDSDSRTKQTTQKRLLLAMRNSPKFSARERTKKSIPVKKEADKRPRYNMDEWKKKLNVVYGYSNAKKVKVATKKSPKTSNVPKKPTNLNNIEYIPYSKLTLGGARVSDIEREISNLSMTKDINMPLSPILDKILSSRENSFCKDSPRKGYVIDQHILTTSDENLLQEVINIERSVSETLSKNTKKKLNKPVIKSPKMSSESNEGAEENDSYADDFEDEKSEHSDKSNKLMLSTDEESEANPIKNEFEDKNNDVSENEKSQAEIETRSGPNIKNKTFSKVTNHKTQSNLSIKDSVDIFEFVHSVDTQETATQSNGTNKISPKETQTSPRYDKPTIQPIHNDLWSSIDPRQQVEKMFELEKDFIKRLIINEYGDLIEKNINKPSTSTDIRHENSQRNISAMQKNTQTSPAHVKSVMTSPKKTKTRTTSPFNLSVPVHQQTSPMILVTNEIEQNTDIGVEADDISVNLSSPRFSLRLPQNSREVFSNLGDQSRTHSKISSKHGHHNKTFTKSTVTSSTSVEAEISSSEMSSLGEVKVKRRLRRRVPSISECSSSSSVSKYSCDLQSVGILPLRSEGEVSLGQVRSRRLVVQSTKSDGEASCAHVN